MRKTRADIALLKKGEGDSERIKLKRALYRGQMQKYIAFSEGMNLPEQKDRIYQDGLGRMA